MLDFSTLFVACFSPFKTFALLHYVCHHDVLFQIYTSMRHACSCIVKEEGPRALYKGLFPTLIQIAPYTGLQFGFYALFNAIWNTLSGAESSSKPGMLVNLHNM